VTLEGDVVLLLDDLEMRTDKAHYDHAADRSPRRARSRSTARRWT
jgi:hypothetical protein